MSNDPPNPMATWLGCTGRFNKKKKGETEGTGLSDLNQPQPNLLSFLSRKRDAHHACSNPVPSFIPGHDLQIRSS